MCIVTTTNPKTCCCGCSLGVGVMLFGILEGLGLLGQLGSGNTYGIVYQTIMVILFIMIAAQPTNPNVSKIVFYIYAAGVVITVLGVIIALCLT